MARARAAQKSDRRRLGWGGALIALVIVASALIIWQWPGEVAAPPVTGSIPTPIGFPDTAQDVGTVVGKAVPVFTLSDETGASITVEPGADEKPTVLIFNMGLGWQLCVQQLGELQTVVAELESYANVYSINRDAPAQTVQVRQSSRTTLPILYDETLDVARQFDFLPKRGQPMGGMSGIPQMGFVIIDAQGVIRVQRVDIYYGDNGSQILEIIKSL